MCGAICCQSHVLFYHGKVTSAWSLSPGCWEHVNLCPIKRTLPPPPPSNYRVNDLLNLEPSQYM